ncbi:MAG: hypothetical protein AB1814_03130 [Thermodesulfobacteriota bacterium]
MIRTESTSTTGRILSRLLNRAQTISAGWAQATPHYWRALCIVFAVYVVLYGALLIATNGLPYVMDNNESFSTYFHAKNAYDFGWGQTWGLADEAFSPHAEAHPYTYTHGGNLSRFYAYLLYSLGARSIESQIIIYTLTVGVLAIFFMFHFFAKTTNSLFAVIICLAFMGEYVLFAQWHVCTLRVWHAFFLFSSLLCVYGFLESDSRRWWLLTFLNFMALFYFELVFATFVGVITGLYGGWLLYRRPVRLAVAWGMQLLGSLSAMGLLIGQNIGLLGWDNFKTDLALTFSARNYDPNGSFVFKSFDSLRQFYEGHHLAFWYNIYDISSVKRFIVFVRSIFQYGFELITPLISLCAVFIVVAWLLSLLLDWLEGSDARHSRPPLATLDYYSRLLLLGGAGSLFTLALISIGTSSYLGAPITPVPQQSTLMGMLLLWLTLLALAWGAAYWGARTSVRPTAGFPIINNRRVIASVIFLLAAGWFIRWQGGLYSQISSPIWAQVLSFWGKIWIPMLALVLSGALGAGAVLLGPRRLLGLSPREQLLPVARYIVCALLAYGAVYLVFPGYVYSGYLVRSAPLLVFFISPILAVGAYILIRCFCLTWCLGRLRWQALHLARLSTPAAQTIDWHYTTLTNMAPLIATVVLGAFGLFFGAYWVNVQIASISLMPPDHLSFLHKLAQPPYRGASFVTNTYAAPISYATRQWAYLDSDGIPKLKISLGEKGYTLHTDYRYLWMADRDKNPAYRQPDYYLCFHQQRYSTSVQNQLFLRSKIPYAVSCSQQPIVQRALYPGASPLHPSLVALGSGPTPSWAIVKLDWKYPPYLGPLSGLPPGQRVGLSPQKSNDKWSLILRYSYQQQQGHPEGASRIKVYARSTTETSFKLKPSFLLKSTEQGGEKEIVIPKDFQGIIRVGLTPISQWKAGQEYLSGAWLIRHLGARPVPAPSDLEFTDFHSLD